MATDTIYPPNSTSLNDIKRYESILSVQDLKERYLHGVDLRDNAGKVLPDRVLEFHIDAAITEIEHETEIFINPISIEEAHDYIYTDYMQWSPIELYETPVIEVTAFEIEYEKDNALTSFPLEWIRLDNRTGMIRITATTGAIQEWIFTQAAFLPRLLTRVRDFPDFFKITYTAGFEQDKIPKNINHLIGMLAAIYTFNIAGDIVLGAGIAAQSLSIDGLSQNIQTTSSAENSAYSARIIQYAKLIKLMKESIMRYYGKGIVIGVV